MFETAYYEPLEQRRRSKKTKNQSNDFGVASVSKSQIVCACVSNKVSKARVGDDPVLGEAIITYCHTPKVTTNFLHRMRSITGTNMLSTSEKAVQSRIPIPPMSLVPYHPLFSSSLAIRFSEHVGEGIAGLGGRSESKRRTCKYKRHPSHFYARTIIDQDQNGWF